VGPCSLFCTLETAAFAAGKHVLIWEKGYGWMDGWMDKGDTDGKQHCRQLPGTH